MHMDFGGLNRQGLYNGGCGEPWLAGNVDPEIIQEFNLPKVDTSFFVEFCETLLDATDLKAPENGAPE